MLREQTRILEAELSEAAVRRLGHGFRVREIHIESGSIEVFALVTAASYACVGSSSQLRGGALLVRTGGPPRDCVCSFRERALRIWPSEACTVP